MNGKKRFYRPTEGRYLAGVASGIARYFNFDPTIARLAFVVLSVLGVGSPVLAYLVMWIVMPDEARLPAADAWESPEFEATIDHEGPSSLGDDVRDAVSGAVSAASDVLSPEPVRGGGHDDQMKNAVDTAVQRASDGSKSAG